MKLCGQPCQVFSEADSGRPDDGCLRELSLNDSHNQRRKDGQNYYIQGRNQRGLAQEMARDETVIAMGEDVIGGWELMERWMPGVEFLALPRACMEGWGPNHGYPDY